MILAERERRGGEVPCLNCIGLFLTKHTRYCSHCKRPVRQELPCLTGFIQCEQQRIPGIIMGTFSEVLNELSVHGIIGTPDGGRVRKSGSEIFFFTTVQLQRQVVSINAQGQYHGSSATVSRNI